MGRFSKFPMKSASARGSAGLRRREARRLDGVRNDAQSAPRRQPTCHSLRVRDRHEVQLVGGAAGAELVAEQTQQVPPGRRMVSTVGEPAGEIQAPLTGGRAIGEIVLDQDHRRRAGRGRVLRHLDVLELHHVDLLTFDEAANAPRGAFVGEEPGELGQRGPRRRLGRRHDPMVIVHPLAVPLELAALESTLAALVESQTDRGRISRRGCAPGRAGAPRRRGAAERSRYGITMRSLGRRPSRRSRLAMSGSPARRRAGGRAPVHQRRALVRASQGTASAP